MNALSARFPNDLAYTVFFDATVFVTATIEEVIRTLVIAIILVAIVVFLFLGKVRTTLIPLVAVPVSIVGTFAVLLLIGYSANTVSLLALVLAIGIVVDDAIVVVENIERVIDEEPNLTIPEACKKAMAEITGLSSRLLSFCSRCSCQSPLFRALAATFSPIRCCCFCIDADFRA